MPQPQTRYAYNRDKQLTQILRPDGQAVEFLYNDGESCHFMDQQSYDQFAISVERLEEAAPWLVESLVLQAVAFNGQVVGVNLPQFVEAEVDMVGGGSRGDTASGRNLKDALLTLPQVSRVNMIAEPQEQVTVDLDDATARRYTAGSAFLASRSGSFCASLRSSSTIVSPRAEL